MSSDREITRIRRLIDRMKGDLDGLSDEDRVQVEDAVAVVCRGRSKIVSLGMPRIRQPSTRPAIGAHRMTISNPMIDGRADPARRRQRASRPSTTPGRTGGEISVSATAREAGVDRRFLYRHADLLGQVHTTQANAAASQGDGPMVSRASLQGDLANAQGQATRQAARIRQLETKLSELLGE